ncbi:MAG: ABC transporter permease [Alphaproteobacteria bacterium]|nr:ABC transporter permease [Alphaproteobacteria bacterium]
MAEPPRGERAVPFRGHGFVLARRRFAAPLFFFGMIALWQVACDRGWISPLFLPSPYAVLLAFRELIEAGTLARHLGESLFRMGLGWLFGTIAGLFVGFLMGIFSLSRAIGQPVVSALFPIPKIALLPLLILWLGIGEASKVTTIVLGVFFPTAIATYSAIDNVPRNLIRMAQSFGLPWNAVLRKIVLPGALPGILAGFRISVSIALLLLTAAEMVGAEYGIGAFILTAGNLMLTDQLLAGVVMLSALGLGFGTLLARLERWLLRWR